MPSVRWTGLAALALALTAPAWAETLRLDLSSHGAIETVVSVTHAIDGAHFCSAAPDPWHAALQIDTRPAPYPFYRVIFDQPDAHAELANPGPSLGLALSNYFAAARTHFDAVNDSIELVLQGRSFVGHAGLGDPDFRLMASYAPDGQGGYFLAHHLHERNGAGGVIDVEGTWHCPRVAAAASEVVVSVHTLFAGAIPARGGPVSLHLVRSDIPCVERDCAGWRVSGEEEGEAILARVDFRHLTLAPGMREAAEGGWADLSVLAEIEPGEPPVVVPMQLTAVEMRTAPVPISRHDALRPLVARPLLAQP